MSKQCDILVIGIGNDFRRDDGAGLWVARQLRDKFDGRVLESHGDLIATIDVWGDAKRVYIVDAAKGDAIPGTVHQIDGLTVLPPVRSLRGSSHGQDIFAVIELARSLGRLPQAVNIIAIEGEHFSYGTELSSAVRRGAERALEIIIQDARRGTQEAADA